MLGKLFFLFASVIIAFFCFAVYAPPAPLKNDNEVPTHLFRKPVDLQEASLMIHQLRQDLNKQSKSLKNAYAAMAPAALSEYIARFLQNGSHLPVEDMLQALNMSVTQLEEYMFELCERADLDGGQKLKTAMVEMAGEHFIRWKYVLTFPSSNENIEGLKTELNRASHIDEEIFCREMTFFFVKTWKTWSFVHSFTIPLELDAILHGLHLYKLADMEHIDVVKAIRVLYDSQIKGKRDYIMVNS